jgi:hypothetical protein
MICMNKMKVNLYLDITILIVFVTISITAVLKFIKMNSPLVNNVHNYFGWILILLLSLHFLLHVEWIIAMIKRKPKETSQR